MQPVSSQLQPQTKKTIKRDKRSSIAQSQNREASVAVSNGSVIKKDTVVSQVELYQSSSSRQTSRISMSQYGSSSLSAKSSTLGMSSRTAKKQAVKQVVHFGGDEEKFLKNRKNTNRIRTNRYTILSWAPLSLLFQFKRAANIYFLIICILTCMSFSPKSPLSMIGTFALVLFFTMIKDGYEDHQRYKADREVNKMKTKVFDQNQGKFISVASENVKMGNIIRLEKENQVLADVLLIYTSNVSGLVFADTMNLDGETNLKEKQALCENFNESLINSFNGEIQSDSPNEHLEFWEGNINSPMVNSKVILCNIKNLLLRGCYVRNTEFAYGIVIYTGMETKIMQNIRKTPRKISNVMKKMNKMLYTVFAFQIALIGLFAGLNVDWTKNNIERHPEVGDFSTEPNLGKTFIIQMLTFWVAYSHMIPISLYVTIELLKLGQSFIVNSDVQMFDRETEQFANARNSDLIEELGQVEMIFSDKTGTLTMNKMVFKKCQIGGRRVGDPNSNEDVSELDGMCLSGINRAKQYLLNETLRTQEQKDGKQLSTPFLSFYKGLALCHTIVCEIDSNTKEVKYSASSPDELALVNGAKDVGIQLIARNHGNLILLNKFTDDQEIYKVVSEFPFDSTRKCMSVIVRDQSQKYYLYCKGADNVILEKINFEKEKQKAVKEQIDVDLRQYSQEGLRTLVIGMRAVAEKEFEMFMEIYNKLMNSNHPFKDKKIKELYAKMESKLRYLGCTAIEDKLQEGVPSTISKLIQAEIRFWMLTGDKLETAIEIAKSCKVIQDSMHVITLQTNDFEQLNQILNSQIEQFDLDITKKVKSLKDFEQQNVVIAIDGSTLNLVLEDPELEQKFFYVSLITKSVVCCRVSPKQKADVVALYKKRGSWVTLGVGDGANDVSMILEANIGIGIRGKEGTQAVRSADYSISQFRFLQKLLLIHGRWGYKRISKMICYYFYKNIVCVFTEIYFAFFNGFSGQIYFLDWLPMLYNSIFTSWQCLFAFLLEQDVNPNYALKYPILYKPGQNGEYFTFGIFWRQIIFAIWHGVVCFYLPMIGGQKQSATSAGSVGSHWLYSTVSFTLIIHLVCYKLFIESNFWNILSLGAAILSLLLYYILVLFGSLPPIANLIQPELNGLMFELFGNTQIWMMIIVVPFICLIPDMAHKYGKVIFFPTPVEKIMKEQKQNPNYNYFEEFVKKDIMSYLSGVIRKNKSVGQLTSKALSEIDKLSDGSGKYKSIGKLFRINNPTSQNENDLDHLKVINSNSANNSKLNTGDDGPNEVGQKQNLTASNDNRSINHQIVVGDTSHILNDSMLSENAMLGLMSGGRGKTSFQKGKKAKGENKNDYKIIIASETMRRQKDQSLKKNSNPIPKDLTSQEMKEESYKQRKERLMMNIQKSQKQDKEAIENQLHEFHNTTYHNEQVKNKVDILIEKSIQQQEKIPVVKKVVKNGEKGKQKQQLELGDIFGNHVAEKYNIPHIINKSDVTPNPQINTGQLLQQGHPLERLFGMVSPKKNKKKRYIEKYRDIISKEKLNNNDFKN